MDVVVFSHKECWVSTAGKAGYATDGGFAKQMDAISELFDHTTICVPIIAEPGDRRESESPFQSPRITISPLPELEGRGWPRRLRMPFWMLRVIGRLWREVAAADAVHTPIPGDIGTFGIVLADIRRRPLLVRYCGNWFLERTPAEKAWHWYMRRFAGGRRVMLATGGAPEPPERSNPELKWIFSASLREHQLPDDEALRAKPAIEDGLRLAFVGRQEPYKGTGAVLEALPKLLPQHPGLHFDVYGDGAGLDGFRQKAETLGLDDLVTFHGNAEHSRVVEALTGSHVLVFPTESEGFPKVVAEALACGTPVVASPVSVLATLITDEIGRQLPSNDPDSIAEAILATCDEGYAERSARAVGVGRKFTLDRWRDEIGGHVTEAWGPTLTEG